MYIWVCAKLTRLCSGTEVQLSALDRRMPFRLRSGAARSGSELRVQQLPQPIQANVVGRPRPTASQNRDHPSCYVY